MKLILSIAAATLIAIVPAAAKAEEPVEDKVICKRDRAPALGSNMRSRSKTCLRASEWKEIELLNERAKLRLQDKMRGGPRPIEGAVGGSGN